MNETDGKERARRKGWLASLAVAAFTIAAAVAALLLPSSCDFTGRKLTVFAGLGLKLPMEEIRERFSAREKVMVHMIYGGSSTLLATIRTSGSGDVFVPGSLETMDQAAELVARQVPVALHVPVVAVHPRAASRIHVFEDLARPGVVIGLANGGLAALGVTSEEIIRRSGRADMILANVRVKAPTVEILLDLVTRGELDAAILWSDMLRWPGAGHLKAVAIPGEINQVERIHAAVLTGSRNRQLAGRFVDFMAGEGAEIFVRHGFGALP